ncbi:MAG TPA: hypothetical protein VMR34_03150 [Candidatus Saccharimonadales bacterium]|nr:hypothetical protein [Candidatus Saccharimonadales bacterium]
MYEHSKSEFSILEDWEGEVIALDNETFDARMVSTKQEISNEAIITFQLNDVPAEMRVRIRRGETLRWINGEYNGTTVDAFDIDLAPGQVPVTQRTLPSLGELASTSRILRQNI